MLTKNLQILRKKHYLSLEKFGNIFGVSKQLVHNWEKGVRKPDIFMLKKIANHFGLEVDQLLEGELTIREPQLDYTPNESLNDLKAELWDMRKRLDQLEGENKKLTEENELLRVRLNTLVDNINKDNSINENSSN